MRRYFIKSKFCIISLCIRMALAPILFACISIVAGESSVAGPVGIQDALHGESYVPGEVIFRVQDSVSPEAALQETGISAQLIKRIQPIGSVVKKFRKTYD